MVRYADDAVAGACNEEDSRRVLDVLPKRLGRYGLGVNKEKTKMIRFSLVLIQGRQIHLISCFNVKL